MPFAYYLSKILTKLYQYPVVKNIKNKIRPIKHAVFGKNDIYWVVDQIEKTRGPRNPVKVVFDIGAAVGDKTITFLKEFPKATIYCFEPQTRSFIALQKQTIKWKKRIRLFKIGLYNKEQNTKFHLNLYPDASSILPPRTEMKRQRFRQETIMVYRLDDIVKKLKIKKIDFLKIDVEGVEKEVIEGGVKTIKDKVENIFIEMLPLRKPPLSRAHIEVFQMLNEAGFSFIGCFGDYFFSKDKALINKYFNKS